MIQFGVQTVRLLHYLIMFLIIAFTIHHVYSAVLIDIEEQRGLVSSIMTGRKSLTARHIAEAEEEAEKPEVIELGWELSLAIAGRLDQLVEAVAQELAICGLPAAPHPGHE